MRNNWLNYVLVGVFVSAMALALVVALALIAGRTGVSDRYGIVFDNVADVKFGTQVRFEGYPVGQIEEIEPLAEDGRVRFRVEVSVEKGWPIPADSVARIGKTSFLAAKTVEIEAGRSADLIAPGGEIPGGPPADMFAAMGNLAGQVGDLTREGLSPLLERINGLMGSADDLVTGDLTALLGQLTELAGTFNSRAPEITDQLADFTRGLDESVVRIRGLLSADNLATVERTLRNVEATSERFAGLSGELNGTVARIEALLLALQAVVEANRGDLDKTVQDAQYTLRAIAQSIDAINHNLEATTRNMNEFSRLIRSNPGVLLRGTNRGDEVAQ